MWVSFRRTALCFLFRWRIIVKKKKTKLTALQALGILYSNNSRKIEKKAELQLGVFYLRYYHSIFFFFSSFEHVLAFFKLAWFFFSFQHAIALFLLKEVLTFSIHTHTHIERERRLDFRCFYRFFFLHANLHFICMHAASQFLVSL